MVRLIPDDKPILDLYYIYGFLLFEDNQLKNIYFIDFSSKETLAKYYLVADLFVLATRGDTWGLVINEAMSKGLPIITTDKCVAGLELVENDINGYIFPSESVDQLSKYIQDTIYDSEKCSRMGKASLEKIKWYSYENMASTVYNYLSEFN